MKNVLFNIKSVITGSSKAVAEAGSGAGAGTGAGAETNSFGSTTQPNLPLGMVSLTKQKSTNPWIIVLCALNYTDPK